MMRPADNLLIPDGGAQSAKEGEWTVVHVAGGVINGTGKSVDLEAQIEIEALLARYCHRVDHDDSVGWADLFTADGSFVVEGAFRLDGMDQLRTMPAIVREHGGGKWRHQIMNIVAEEGVERDTARVMAYGLVSEWRDGGKLVSFSDYEILMRQVDGTWRIITLLAHMV